MTQHLTSLEAQCLHAHVFASDLQINDYARVNQVADLDAYIAAAREYLARWYPELDFATESPPISVQKAS